MMRRLTCLTLVGFLLGTLTAFDSVASASESSTPPATTANTEGGPVLENLLRTLLEGVEGTEVIVSRVSIPPHTSLPKHWHPGEEFAYVLDGSVILWQEGEEDIVGEQGDAVKVPLKKVHTAMTKDEAATVLVFRVHEQGQPERILVE